MNEMMLKAKEGVLDEIIEMMEGKSVERFKPKAKMAEMMSDEADGEEQGGMEMEMKVEADGMDEETKRKLMELYSKISGGAAEG